MLVIDYPYTHQLACTCVMGIPIILSRTILLQEQFFPRDNCDYTFHVQHNPAWRRSYQTCCRISIHGFTFVYVYAMDFSEFTLSYIDLRRFLWIYMDLRIHHHLTCNIRLYEWMLLYEYWWIGYVSPPLSRSGH